MFAEEDAINNEDRKEFQIRKNAESFSYIRKKRVLALQANNIKLCHSRQYCSCLTLFGQYSLVCSLKTKNLWFSDVSKGYKKLTLTSILLF